MANTHAGDNQPLPRFKTTLKECLKSSRRRQLPRDRFGDIARQRGVPFKLVMYEAIAAGCCEHHQPLPTEMREYLMQHAAQIDPDLRAKLLKPELS